MNSTYIHINSAQVLKYMYTNVNVCMHNVGDKLSKHIYIMFMYMYRWPTGCLAWHGFGSGKIGGAESCSLLLVLLRPMSHDLGFTAQTKR